MIAALALVLLTQVGPRDLPRAEPGRWADWKPDAPIPAEVQEAFARCLEAYQAGDLDRALAQLLDVLKVVPDYPAALYQAGVACFRLRRYGDAAELVERFVAAAPGELRATRVLGHCYYSLGEYERAAAHYEKIRALAPDDVENLRGLALCHMRLGRPEPALELLGRVLELAPDHASAHGWRAQILFDEGRLAEARASVERAQALAPFEPEHAFLASRILAELGLDEVAEQARQRFLELDRVAQAVRHEEGLLLHDPRRLSSWVRLAELHRSIGDVPSLRSALARALALEPRSPELRLFGLESLVAVGDKEGASLAAAAMEQACPAERAVWQHLIGFYRSIGDKAGEERAVARHAALK
jgi:tetratricopeptide (TPR) repeat protein